MSQNEEYMPLYTMLTVTDTTPMRTEREAFLPHGPNSGATLPDWVLWVDAGDYAGAVVQAQTLTNWVDDLREAFDQALADGASTVAAIINDELILHAEI